MFLSLFNMFRPKKKLRAAWLHAAASGDLAGLQGLLWQGANTLDRDKYDCDALMLASEAGHAHCLPLLMGAGCSPLFASSFEQCTALGLAVRHGHLACLRILIEAGSDVDAVNFWGEPLLLESLRSQSHKAEVFAALVAAGADLEKPDKDGFKPLTIAAKLANSTHPQSSCLAMLIEAGADVDARDLHGASAAMTMAASYGGEMALQMLVDAGCDVDSRDRLGTSPAMVACVQDRADSLSILVAAGCDIDAVDLEGNTAAMFACEHFGGQTLGILLAAGCRMDLLNQAGLDAQGVALERRNHPCSAAIERHQLAESTAAGTTHRRPARI